MSRAFAGLLGGDVRSGPHLLRTVNVWWFLDEYAENPEEVNDVGGEYAIEPEDGEDMVEAIVRVLWQGGYVEPSASTWTGAPGVWWSWEDAQEDYRTGRHTMEHMHLENVPLDVQERVYRRMIDKRKHRNLYAAKGVGAISPKRLREMRTEWQAPSKWGQRGRLIGPLQVTRIHLDRGGYDSRGRYYGVGAPLFEITSDEGDGYVVVRAASAADARALMRKLPTSNAD